MLFPLLKISLTIVLIGAFFYIVANWKLHCPKCRKVFAAKVSNKKTLKENKVQEMAWNEKKGKDEMRNVNYKTIEYEYVCKYCKHKWKTKKEES